ncbi:competence protein ComF [Legionella norrlandica]|uniref:Competence protein ComF n=2 Tax=Legionella norrlandica TaxID=1498499 RepID=A0A0A2T6Q1_9GAMM|nr:ComF family protein [Legionella norrlandica]KGP63108.1 competence protein ComF [Legionella norrlandica]
MPLGISCQYCAYPLPDDAHLICGQCIKKRPNFDNAYVAYQFEEPLRGLLHQFKYHNGLYLASFLNQLLINAIPPNAPKPECLIPVPMHPKRLKIRGFNQAAVLSKLLARQLKIPYDLYRCKKVINTATQVSLSGEERRKNLKNAFYTPPLPYEHVMLVDDLLTTGSTANELAYTLKKAGVKRVDICCCARTVNHN